MTKKMRLECTITNSETVGMWYVSSVQYDGTPFTLKVSTQYVQPNEPVEDGRNVTGFLVVDHVGQQHQRAAIVLPAGADVYGCNVTVNALKLQPYKSNISMFGGKKVKAQPVFVEESADGEETLLVVDPPAGLTAEEVVEWHDKSE